MSRRWGSWPSRFAEKVESTSGMVGLFGGLATVTGLVVAAPIATAIGGVALGCAVLHAGVSSFPPKVRTTAEFIDQQLSLDDLLALDPIPPKLAVVGASKAGKSTFLSAAQHSTKPSTRTHKIVAEILMLAGNPPRYIALLDADGKEFVQQFELVREADFLLIFIDHNSSATDKNKSTDRLAEHDRFLEQIEPVLKRRKSPPKIHLIFNKRDLWEDGPDSADVMAWFENHVAAWKRIHISTEFSFGLHSNKSIEDTAEMMGSIRKFVSARASS